MELFTIQAITTGVEAGGAPKALERCPGFVAACSLIRFVAINRFHDEPHPRALRESGALIGFEDAVFESCSHNLNHVFTSSWSLVPTAYPIEFTRAS
jgi:hypothetical protein